MNMSRARVFALTITAILYGVAYARRQDSDQASKSGQTGLALEIVFLKGQQPGLFPVAGPKAKQSGGWSSRFGKIAGWKLPDGTLPVRAVQVASKLENEHVKVWVSVLLGQQSHEREEPVSVFDIDEGQTVEAVELTKFGVEPIEIKLVKAPSYVPVFPQIDNKTESVVVTNITAVASTIPFYRISLQNISSRDVAALEVEIMVGGKQELMAMPQGKDGLPLMAVGGSYALAFPGSYQIRPGYGDHPPDFTRDHFCVIRAAMFEDGSFEGDPESAARFRGYVIGRKIQLRRVVALLQEALDSRDEVIPTLQRLRAGLSGLNANIDGDEAQAMLKDFPGLSVNSKVSLKPSIDAALGSVKKITVEGLNEFEHAQAAAPDKSAFQTWLLANKEKYAVWLSRL